MNKHIVSVSGGASSAAALLRVTELYPKDSVFAVFANTNWEFPDVYRFIDELEEASGVEIKRLNQGLNPADISASQQMIFNSRVAKCTQELQVKPIQEYVKMLIRINPDDRYFMHIGYNMDDTTESSCTTECSVFND